MLFVCGTAVLLYLSMSSVSMQLLQQFRHENASRFTRGRGEETIASPDAMSDETYAPKPIKGVDHNNIYDQ